MLKIYHQNIDSGSSAQYWAKSWDDVDFENALSQCAEDPIRPLFDKYVTKDSLIFEGGCGKGHWVAYFADKGNKVVGLDFAHRTLAELDKRRDGLTLACGDVNSLPFSGGVFDIYYSGGVVEHFEDGCERSLMEARRVLSADGYLLISVPYYSPLRRVLKFFKRNSWQKCVESEIDKTPPSPGMTFFQYAYTPREFERYLAKAGLRPIHRQGYSVIWGLYDIPQLSHRAVQPAQVNDSASKALVPTKPAANKSLSSIVKHYLIGESSSTLSERIVTRSMRWACANMMMYVCKKI